MAHGKSSRTRFTLQLCLGAALLAWAVHGLARIDAPRSGGAKASIGYGPIAPPAVARRVPADVSARLVFREDRHGPMIRVLEGDRVTLKMVNPADSPQACTVRFEYPRGDGELSVGPVAPGEQATRSFVATAPGLYAYVADAGDLRTSGLLLVEPLYGYRRADTEFYLMVDRHGLSVPAEASLAAEPGRRARLFVGNAGAASATLSLGGQVTEVSLAGEDLSTPLPSNEKAIEPGAAGILELDLADAGEVELVAKVNGGDVTRTVLRVEETQEEPDAGEAFAGGADMSPEMKAKMAAGKAVYDRTCIACHQATGLGIPGVYPPLAQSDYLIADVDRAIHGVIKGQPLEYVRIRFLL